MGTWSSRLLVIGWLLLNAAAAQSQMVDTLRVQQLLVRSLTYLQIDRPDQAIPLLEETLSLLPGEPAILITLARAHRQQNNLETAFFYAEQACRRAAEEVSYCHEALDLLQASQRLDAARTLVAQILQRHPNDRRALAFQAEEALKARNFAIARQLYEKLLTQYGPDTAWYRALWPLQLATGDTLAALASLEALAQRAPEDPTLWRTLGTLYLARQSTSQARTALQRALRLNPHDTAAARLLSHMGEVRTTPAALLARVRQLLREPPDSPQRQEAQYLLNQLLAQDSNQVEALRLQAALLAQAHPERAAALLERSLHLDPRDLNTWTEAARLWLIAGYPRRSVRTAEEGLFLFPGQLRLLHLAAYAQLQTGNLRAALTHLETLLALQVEYPDLTPEEVAEWEAFAGRLWAQLEAPQNARQACSQALRRRGTTPAIAAHCAVVRFLVDRQSEAALRQARQAARENQDSWILETLAWLELQAGHPEAARDVLQPLLSAKRASPLAYAYYGEALARLGLLDAARQAWQEALQRDPENPHLRQLLPTYRSP